MDEAIRSLVVFIWAASAVNADVNTKLVTTYAAETETKGSAQVLVVDNVDLRKNRYHRQSI